MKKLISFLFLFTLSFAHADSGSFVFDGTELENYLNLSGVESHTEYDRVAYQGTCSEYRYVGRRQQCSYRDGRTVCHVDNNGNRRCRTQRVRDCRWVDDYDWVYYPCTKYRTVSREVIDYYLKADVKVNFKNVPEGLDLNEKVTASFNQGVLKLSSKGLGNAVLLAKTRSSYEVDGDNKYYTIDVDVTVKDLKKVLSVNLNGVQNVKITPEALTYELGEVSSDIIHKQVLKIKRSRRLKDKTVFRERTLAPNEYAIEQVDGKSIITIDLTSVQLEEEMKRKKKYKIKIESIATIKGGKVINASEVNPLLKKKYEGKLRANY